jgi:hypothetical protein
MPSGPAIKNGMRQPQDVVASSQMRADSTVTATEPIRNPMRVENISQLTMYPLRSSGEYSATNEAAPPYSPPTENPCSNRRKTSKIGAQMPIVA